MVITVIGLSALMLARVERSSAEGTADLSTARFYAQSAIEMGQHYIRQNSTWRDIFSNGEWLADQQIGTGTYTLEGIDPTDGDLNDSATDPLLLRGTGFEGQSRYKLQVTMVSKSNALTCLEVAMHAGSSMTFSSANVQSNLVTISANGSVTTASSMIYPKVEAVGTISGTGYQSSITPGITARTMPAASVFDSYILNGTPILITSIPSVQGVKTIEKGVLSSGVNPYGLGQKNANGIYVIDCLLGNLRIRNCRIVGTLVILNPGTFSIQNSVNWEPGVANYPSLLVRGNAEIAFTNSQLSEGATGANYNPPGTPYLGASNLSTTDVYPSEIKGLVYASGNVSAKNYVTIDGVLVVGSTLSTGPSLTMSLTYRSIFYDNPPPGFGGAPEMVISPGTWKQLVD